jgi:hypothetical protein
MRDRLLAALLTLAVFATGFGAGAWRERHRPFPAPPGQFLGELGPRGGPHSGAPVNRAQLAEQIDAIRPQMEAFRTRLNEIYAQFDRDMEAVLTPGQRDTYEKKFRLMRNFDPVTQAPASDQPLTDEQIGQLLQRPFRTLAFLVVVPMALDRMSTELKLDDAQRDKVRDFLRVRREKFIELVDGSPPLSMALSRLAPIAQRLGDPAKVPAAH